MDMLITDALEAFATEDHPGGVVPLAEALGVSRQAVYQWVASGTLPAIRVYQLRQLLGNPDFGPDIVKPPSRKGMGPKKKGRKRQRA